MLLQECIDATAAAAAGSGGGAAQHSCENTAVPADFMQSFIDRGGFDFLADFFIAVDKSRLEASTIRNKSLQLLIEILTAFMSSRTIVGLKDKMSQQKIYDVFFQNVLVMQNFVSAVMLQ